eukprot:403994-Pelagomonas_calceolata.AAC.2
MSTTVLLDLTQWPRPGAVQALKCSACAKCEVLVGAPCAARGCILGALVGAPCAICEVLVGAPCFKACTDQEAGQASCAGP